MQSRYSAALIFAMLLVGCEQADPNASFPSKPIVLVVPFSAGGGTDQFARVMKKAISDNELLSVPLVIKNVDGAGATIGSREVKDAEPDGHTMLLLHEAIITAKFSGKVDYGPKAFTPVIGTGEVGMVVAVNQESPYHTLKDLMHAAQESPDTLVWTANLGAPSHFVGLMLEKKLAGARFRYSQSGGGTKRFHEIKGGHAAVTAFSLEEFLRYREGALRGIAFLGSKRHPGIPQIPTASEQGFKVTHRNIFFWWVPKSTPPDRVKVLAAAIQQAMDTEYVQQQLEQSRIDQIVLTGSEMQATIDELTASVAEVDLRKPSGLPNIAAIVFAFVLGLTIAVVAVHRRQSRSETPPSLEVEIEPPSTEPTRPMLSAVVLAVTAAYIGLLSTPWIDFAVATVLFVVVSGGLLVQWKLQKLSYIAALAIILGFGLQFALTQVFEIDLP
ncbi:MAG: tripartite tricarboxylate transporter substrate binding protein [Planctomycetota bacterium]|nr:tripartite tricarboxylate transporter substrate binding protein [Planctomycetota bacterium]